MTFTRTELPTFSWSHSRARTFACCHRKYFYSYYLSHNGWERQRGDPNRAAWMLKKLTTYDAALGESIHVAAAEIARAIRDGRTLPDFSMTSRRIRGAMNRLYLGSRDIVAFEARPSQVKMTIDAYYGSPALPAALERLKQKMERCVENLRTCSIWRELRDARDVRVIEDVGHFEVGGVPVWVKPDLVFRSPVAGWVVVDWKSGAGASAEEQIALYAAYVRDELRLQPRFGAYECRVVNLYTGTIDVVPVDAAAIDRAYARIARSAASMLELLPDPARNDAGDGATFRPTDDPAACRRCEFRALCEPHRR